MSDGYFANVEVVNNNATRFSNAKNGDLVFYTEDSNQDIHFGNTAYGNQVASMSIRSNNIEFGGDIFVRRDLVMRGVKLYKRLPDTTAMGNITQKVETVKGLDTSSGIAVDFSLSNPQTMYRFYNDTNTVMFTLSNQGQWQAKSDNTVALPNYTWMNDSNTGMYHPNQGEVGIATNGVRTMWINSSNINVTTPICNTETSTDVVYDVINIDHYPITGTDLGVQTKYVLLFSMTSDTQSASQYGVVTVQGVMGANGSDACSFTCHVTSKNEFVILTNRTGSLPRNADIVVYYDSTASLYRFYIKCTGKHMYNLNLKYGGHGVVLEKTFVPQTLTPMGSLVTTRGPSGSIFNYTGVVINNSNNFGIGTVNPLYTIDANVSSNDHVRIYSTAPGKRSSLMIAHSNSSNTNGYFYLQQDERGLASVDNFGCNLNITTRGDTVFQTKDNANSNTNRAILTSNGYMGLNTQNPQQLLHLDNGMALFTNSNNSNLLVASGSQCMVAFNNNFQNKVLMGANAGTSNHATLAYNYIAGQSPSNFASLGVAGNENILSVVGTRRVGVMNITPVATLDVNGDIYSSSAIATGARLLTNKLYYAYSNPSVASSFNNLDLSACDFNSNFSLRFLWKAQNTNGTFGGTTSIAIGNKVAFHFINQRFRADLPTPQTFELRCEENPNPASLSDEANGKGIGLLTLPISFVGNYTWGSGATSNITMFDDLPLVISYNAVSKRVNLSVGGNESMTSPPLSSLSVFKNIYTREIAEFSVDFSTLTDKKLYVGEYNNAGRFINTFKSLHVLSDYVEIGTNKLHVSELVAKGSVKASGFNDSASSPSISWTNDPSTGLYYPDDTSPVIGIAVGGSNIANITTQTVSSRMPVVRESYAYRDVSDIISVSHLDVTGESVNQTNYVLIAQISNQFASSTNIGALYVSGVLGGSDNDLAKFDSEISTKGGLSIISSMIGNRSSKANIVIYNVTSENKYKIYIKVNGTHCYNLNLKTVGRDIDIFTSFSPSVNVPSGTYIGDVLDYTSMALNGNNQILASSNDSALRPAYTWNGDLSTGMYHGGSNIIGFTTGLTTNIMTLSNNRVGILNTTPKQALDVNGFIDCLGFINESDRQIPIHSLANGTIRRTFTMQNNFQWPGITSDMDSLVRTGTMTAVDVQNEVVPQGSPIANTGFVFAGYLLITIDGSYRFGVNASDSSDLVIDGTVVASWYAQSTHAPNTTLTPGGITTTIYLRRGFHRLMFRHATATSAGSVLMEALWIPTGTSVWSKIPASQYYRSPSDFMNFFGSNVGVGVIQPNASIHTHRDIIATNYLASTTGSATQPAFSWSNSSNMGMYMINSNAYALSLSGTQLFTLSNGRVGIRQASPSNTLNISGDLLVDKVGGSQVIVRSTSNSDTAEIRLDMTTFSNSAFSHIGQRGTSSNNYFFVYTSNAISQGDRLIVNPMGQIGINERSPVTTLHVRNPNARDAGIFLGSNVDDSGFSIYKNISNDLTISKGSWNNPEIMMTMSRTGAIVIGSNDTPLSGSVGGQPTGHILDINVSNKGGMARIYSSNSSTYATMHIHTSNVNSARQGLKLQQDYNGDAYIDNDGDSTTISTKGGFIYFAKKSGTSAYSNLVYIHSTGSVGIGSNFSSVTPPAAKLDVAGYLKVMGGTDNGMYVGDVQTFYTNTNNVLNIKAPTGVNFLNANNTVMMLDSVGRVGIGLGLATLTERFFVDGNAVITGSVNAGTITASNGFNLRGNMNWLNTAQITMTSSLASEWVMTMTRSTNSWQSSFGIKSDYIPSQQNYIFRTFTNGYINIPRTLVIGRTIDPSVDVEPFPSGFDLYVVNDVRCRVLTEISDSRFKTNLKTIDNALDKVDQLTGYTFEFTDAVNDRRHLGLMAQDVQAVVPEAVFTEADGRLSLSYGNLAGLFVEALKDLRKEITGIKAELQSMRAQPS